MYFVFQRLRPEYEAKVKRKKMNPVTKVCNKLICIGIVY